METQSARTAARALGLLPASEGKGPLLERNYWAIIRHARGPAKDVAAYVQRHFEHFAPHALVEFHRRDRPAGQPLETGDRLDVHIRGVGHFGVRVLHHDALSLTLGTIAGHPEAGRITFGAYPNRHGDVIFHIRSRARASSRLRYYGFVGAGESIQTRCWADFVNRVAVACGDGVLGAIHAETTISDDEPEAIAASTPTFHAVESAAEGH